MLKNKRILSLTLVFALVLAIVAPLTTIASGGNNEPALDGTLIEEKIAEHMDYTIEVINRQAQQKEFDAKYEYDKTQNLYSVTIGQDAAGKGLFGLASTGFATALINPITMGKKGYINTIPAELDFVKITDIKNAARTEQLDRTRLEQISNMSIFSLRDVYNIFAPNGFSNLGSLLDSSYTLEYHFKLADNSEYLSTLKIEFKEDLSSGGTHTPDDEDEAKEKFLKGLEVAAQSDVAEVNIEDENISVRFDKDATEIEIKAAANALVEALQTNSVSGILTINDVDFDLMDANITSTVAKAILDGISPDEFLNKGFVSVDYEATVTSENIQFPLKGKLSFKMPLTNEEAREKFLAELKIKTANIDVAQVEINGEDISVVFDKNAKVKEIKTAANALVDALILDNVDGVLKIKGVEFNLKDANITSTVAKAILDGISPDEFLDKGFASVDYEATVTAKEGIEFTLNGQLNFKMELSTADTSALEKAINNATALLTKYKISQDGKDIEVDEKWVAQSNVDTLKTAIQTAQAIVDSKPTDETIVSDALVDITYAITAFEASAQYGLKEEDPGVLVVSGNDKIAVGEKTKLTVSLGQSNVTADSKWKSSNENIAVVATDGEVTGIAEGIVTITATYNDLHGSYTVTVEPKDVIVPEPGPSIKPGGGGGGGGGGGRGRADTAPNLSTTATKEVTASEKSPYTPKELEKDIAKIETAIAQGKIDISYSVRNCTSVPEETVKKISDLAAKKNVDITIHFDNVKEKVVTSRLSVTFTKGQPVKEIKLTSNDKNTKTATKLFEKYYVNNIQVISLDNENFVGKIALRLNQAMPTENIRLYHYDISSNTYQELNQEVRIDNNGYAHFETSGGRTFILSDGALSK